MSRRDTIIISVLVNAVLLAVLFTTAITKNSVEEMPKMASNAFLEEPTKERLDSIKEQKASETDEKDIQKQFIALMKEKNVKTPLENIAKSMGDKNINLPFDKNSNITLQDNKVNKEEEKIVYKLPQIAKAPIEPKVKSVVANTFEITIKGGDTLERIARSNNVKISDITTLNSLPNSFLRVGQKLLIPEKQLTERTNLPVKTEIKKTYENQEFYIVKVGDNPYTIAMKHSIKPNDLLKLNNLDERKARRLKPGDKLRIR